MNRIKSVACIYLICCMLFCFPVVAGETGAYSTDEFLSDLSESYNQRLAVIEAKVSHAEDDTLEQVQEFADYVNAEREFYDKYLEAELQDTVLQVMCDIYIQGLTKQYDAIDILFEEPGSDAGWDLWDKGTEYRCASLLAMVDKYELPLEEAEVEDIKEYIEKKKTQEEIASMPMKKISFDKKDHCYTMVGQSWRMSKSYDMQDFLGKEFTNAIVYTFTMANDETVEIMATLEDNFYRRYNAIKSEYDGKRAIEYQNDINWDDGVWISEEDDVYSNCAYLVSGSYLDVGIKTYFAYGMVTNPKDEVYIVSMISEDDIANDIVRQILLNFRWDYKYDFQLDD